MSDDDEIKRKILVSQSRKKIIAFAIMLYLIITAGFLTISYASDTDTVRAVQLMLFLKGHDLGDGDSKGVDGKIGSKTLRAISEYKKTLPIEKRNTTDLFGLKKILEDEIKSEIKQPAKNEKDPSVPQNANQIDTIDKIIRIIKPFQEEKELLYDYSHLLEDVKRYGLIFSGTYIVGLLLIGIYYVEHKTSETKFSALKYVQEQTETANSALGKARTDLEAAQRTYKEQEDKIAEEMLKIDYKLGQLSQDISKIMEVRLKLGTINTNYYVAALNWRTGNIDVAIQVIEFAVSLIDSLDDVNDSEVTSKVKQIKDSKQAMQCDLAYYYAQRYAEQNQAKDASSATALVETMPKFIETLSGDQRINMVDNYLFIICKLKDVDKPYIKKFIEYYDNYKESINTLLKHKDTHILAEYSKFYSELTK